ncbi:hypothetical protein AYO37_00130 [Opitutia bacterium SCGC AG-212-L18]|nr:hypothetical protein AYO37_00130 [Opitutae bacterium SCGC AG-212-L18]
MKKQRLTIGLLIIFLLGQIDVWGQRHEGKFPPVFKLEDINGTNGYIIQGLHDFSQQINGKGDVNGDGVKDVLIGNLFLEGYSQRDQVYIIFGNKEKRPQVVDPLHINSSNGVIVNPGMLDSFGLYVSVIGDINKDGIDDMLISNEYQDNFLCVLFGRKHWSTPIVITDLMDGKNGFFIEGDSNLYVTAISPAGDINGDGIDDILMGVGGNNNIQNAGQSYVVFGSKGSWPAVINLKDINGNNGFIINGIYAKDESGYSVSGAGDFNGDGISDVIIGAPFANNGQGQSYIVFGSKGPWPATIDLGNLDGSNGLTIYGIDSSDLTGYSVSGAGDINGDDFDDVIIASNNNDIYVVFGNNATWPPLIDLSNLNGKNGFVLRGLYKRGPFSVSGAGDFNADNITDIIIGTTDAYIDEGYFRRQGYVVFGNKNMWPAEINLNGLNGTGLNGTNGFIINGSFNNMHVRYVVDGIGDVNGDSVDDILIGESYGANPHNGVPRNGYVLFGCCGEVPPPPLSPIEPLHNSLALGLGIGFGAVGLITAGVVYYWWHYDDPVIGADDIAEGPINVDPEKTLLIPIDAPPSGVGWMTSS